MVCVRYQETLISIINASLLSGRFNEDWNDIGAAGGPYTQPATFHFITRDESLNHPAALL